MKRSTIISLLIGGIILLAVCIISTIEAGAQQSAIDQKYDSLNRQGIFLGVPVDVERVAQDHIGHFRRYQYGMIYWTQNTGAHEVHGDILRKWESLGSERSGLGYPITDETADAACNCRFNHFQNGSIYWKPNGEIQVYDIVRKFEDTYRNDFGKMHEHLKMYKDNVVVYGVVLDWPAVNYSPDLSDDRSYVGFMCAQWWYRKRCRLPGDKNCDDDPPDGDMDFRIAIDPEQFNKTPGFWDGWRNDRTPVLNKLKAQNYIVRAETIMYGRAAVCIPEGLRGNPGLRSRPQTGGPHFPLLPGWQETGVNSVRLNGQPIEGRISVMKADPAESFDQEKYKLRFPVDRVIDRELRPGMLVKIKGFLALDCGHGWTHDCHEDCTDYIDQECANVEIHPVYSIDIVGVHPCQGDIERLRYLLDQSSILSAQKPQGKPAVWDSPSFQRRLEAWERRNRDWHQQHDDEFNRLWAKTSGPQCRVQWPNEEPVPVGFAPIPSLPFAPVPRAIPFPRRTEEGALSEVPDVTGSDSHRAIIKDEAIRILQAAGFQYEIVRDGQLVQTQDPPAHERRHRGTTVRLWLRNIE